ncbi:winged helix-turn-helix transcriptional regulator [Aminipila sp.]|uniref:winged helix-turn-helix transcriptional regulator n=1 Tax=Aminipila sp. TaxID=2060095 RepID=UPI00289853D0|nr:helix-turn-helix domain-containing protein [Aminipila sp.]
MIGTNPYQYALSCLGGKWKMTILHHIHHHGVIRFSKTKKTLPVSEKVLSQQLKELMEDGLIERIQYNTIPLKVEYILTPAGERIIPALDMIYMWSIERMRQLNIEIDPDAFLVHTQKKYHKCVSEIIDNYEQFCDFVDYVVEKNLSIEDTTADFMNNKEEIVERLLSSNSQSSGENKSKQKKD